MDLNFKEALATLYSGLPAVLIRAGILAAGGFATIIIFAILLFARRVAGASSPAAAIIATLAVLGLATGGLVVQRCFLFRYRAVMLILFSGRVLPASGLAGAVKESRNIFSSYSQWRALNLKLRRALSFSRGLPRQTMIKSLAGWTRSCLASPADAIIAQAVMILAFSRPNGADIAISLREGLVLFSAAGAENRRRSRRWLWFSAAGLSFIFLCLALPNWFIFSSAGAPVWIGVVLAAIISGLLHQAFVVPLVLAGVSASLLLETRGKIPDPGVCEKFVPFFTP